MSIWKEFKVGNIAKIENGFAFKSKDFSIKGVPIIKIKNVKPSLINTNDLSYVPFEIASKLSKYKINKGDILITMSGNRIDGSPDSWVGKVATFNLEGTYLLNQRVSKIIVSSDDINPIYLSYVLSSIEYQQYFINEANSSGGQANISPETVRNTTFNAPDLPTQTAIAEILSSLDDKIELNNKINQELENLAQTLFKQWFIDFEFPNENGEPYKSSGGEMVESELGEIPKGWEVKTFADVAQVIDCLHSKKPIIFNDSTGYLFLQLSNIKDNGLLDLTQKFWISKEDYQKWISRIEVKEGDFVITNVGRSGAVSRIGKGVKAAIGRNMTALRLKDNFQFNGFFSVLILSDFMKKEINSKLDSGTILDALNVKSIPKLRFTFPLKLELPIEFETIVRPIWDRMETNLIENNSLIDTRDYLLPKLISGDLEINELSN